MQVRNNQSKSRFTMIIQYKKARCNKMKTGVSWAGGTHGPGLLPHPDLSLYYHTLLTLRAWCPQYLPCVLLSNLRPIYRDPVVEGFNRFISHLPQTFIWNSLMCLKAKRIRQSLVITVPLIFPLGFRAPKSTPLPCRRRYPTTTEHTRTVRAVPHRQAGSARTFL